MPFPTSSSSGRTAAKSKSLTRNHVFVWGAMIILVEQSLIKQSWDGYPSLDDASGYLAVALR
jgi:hypothetical protein